jgi:NAD(P)H-flavin reductase
MVVLIITVLIILLSIFLFFLRKPRSFLRGSEIWQYITLIDKKRVSPDSFLFTFALPSASQPLGLPLGTHIVMRATIPTYSSPGGEEIVRKYTPTSRFDVKGRIELLVKVYYATERFPEGGIMSQYLDSLKLGDKIEVSGPKGRLNYLGKGRFAIGKEEVRVKRVGLIAGGTGITPCFQLIQYITDNEPGEIELSLIYANKTEEDILLRSELDTLVKKEQLRVFYTLDNPSQNWSYGKGFVSQDMISEHLPLADCFIAYCGPPPMNNMINKHLKALEIKNSFKF